MTHVPLFVWLNSGIPSNTVTEPDYPLARLLTIGSYILAAPILLVAGCADAAPSQNCQGDGSGGSASCGTRYESSLMFAALLSVGGFVVLHRYTR